MDKKNYHHQIPCLRKGFALLITLSVLSVVIALTVVLLSYFDKVKEDADTTKALIQADIYYADIIAQFAKFKDKKALFHQLYRLPLFLHTPDGRFSLTLKCEPIAKGININWLGLEHDVLHQNLYREAQRVFDILAQDYELESPQRLLEMLLAEIRNKSIFASSQQSRLRQKNGIISYRQFADILSRYQLEEDDRNVGKVPWRKYFSFSGTVQKIDAEYSSPELISLLFDIDLQSVKEWYFSKDKVSLETFINENSLNYAAKKPLLADDKFLNQSFCEVTYGAGYRFTFNYINGGAKYFEFYGKH
jgi:hypothetical protein